MVQRRDRGLHPARPVTIGRERQRPLRPRLRHSLRHWAVAAGSLLVLVALAVTA